jgi:bacterioferritin
VKGNARVVEFLNEALTAELTAINQYFLDSRMCENWGYHRLAAHLRDESMDEMKHAERIADRIIYFEGMPNFQRLGTVSVGESAPEKLHLAHDLETAAIAMYNRGIALCVEDGDNGTRELLEEVLEDEEEHADWLETQFELIKQLGEALYLSQQLRD